MATHAGTVVEARKTGLGHLALSIPALLWSFREGGVVAHYPKGHANNRIVLVKILGPSLLIHHIVYDSTVDVTLKQRVALPDEQVAAFQSVTVGIPHKLLHRVLLFQILGQLEHLLERLHLLTVVVGIVEGELQYQSAHGSLLIIRCHVGGVLGHEDVGRDATTAIHHPAIAGVIGLSGMFDTRLAETKDEILGTVDTRLLETETRILGTVDTRLAETETRILGTVDTRLAETETRILETVDTKLANSENMILNQLDTVQEHLESKIDKIQQDVNEIKRSYKFMNYGVMV